MKKFYVCTLVLVLSIFSFVSCRDSDDRRHYVSLVTVVQGGEKLLFMKSDSLLLNPTNFNIPYNIGQRMLVEYEIRDTHETNAPYKYNVEVYDYNTVLTKSVVDLTTTNQTAIGNDGYLAIYGIGSEGGYLNVNLGFLYNYIPHYINLVSNTVTLPTPVDTPEAITLELRQNANGANSGYAVNELVSFNVQKYIDAARIAGSSTLSVNVKVMFLDSSITTYNVVFNTGVVNTEGETYNSLSYYDFTPSATQ